MSLHCFAFTTGVLHMAQHGEWSKRDKGPFRPCRRVQDKIVTNKKTLARSKRYSLQVSAQVPCRLRHPCFCASVLATRTLEQQQIFLEELHAPLHYSWRPSSSGLTQRRTVSYWHHCHVSTEMTLLVLGISHDLRLFPRKQLLLVRR